MKTKITTPFLLAALLLTPGLLPAAHNQFTDAEAAGVKAFLRDNFRQTNACIVIGLVDEEGKKIFTAGKLDNGIAREVDGDSIFFIGSVSKTFTALLLQDAIARGEMKQEDSVATYLPKSVSMPTHGGKQITLFDLATHGSGLPSDPNNTAGKDVREQYESYTVEKMYAFLSGYSLSRDPGTEFEYSNVGMALLGHAIALNAGTNFESLVVDRIARPLQMDSTCITLNAEQQKRLAMGHDSSGKPSTPWKFQAYSPAGNIHSTANDLLKYASVHAGISSSALSPLMRKTHVIRFKDSRGHPDFGNFGRIAMDWVDRDAYQPAGMELLGHAGGAGSYHAWVGFDTKQRRGVVVLSTANDLSVEAIGWTVLQRLPLKPESLFSYAREMVGLGFAFDLDQQKDTLRITKVFPDSPASRAGLSPGTIIARIDDIPTAGKTLAECRRLLSSNGRSKVRMELINQRNESNSVELARGKFVTLN